MNKITLEMHMNSDAFSKARFAEKIKEPGIFARLENNSWKFENWSFSDVSEDSDGMVSLVGESEAFVPYEMLLEDEEKSLKSSEKLFACLSSIGEFKKVKSLPGPGGIFFGEDFNSVLFLPELFFSHSAKCGGEEDYARKHGVTHNPLIKDKRAVLWFKACVAYRLVSGKFPFEDKNEDNRTNDIIDGNFRLLEWTAPNLDESFCRKIDSVLSENDGKEKIDDISFEDVLKNVSHPNLSAEKTVEFEEKIRRLESKRQKRISAIRWVRSKSTYIAVAGILLAGAIFVGFSYYRSLQRKPCTIGLSPEESIEMFFSGINSLDTEAAQYSSTREMGGRVSILSNLYVTSKARAMYVDRHETVSPAIWFCYRNPEQFVYGITCFRINGVQANAFKAGPKKNSHPKPVAAAEGERKTFDVEYNLIDAASSKILNVAHVQEKVTVVYRKNRWLVESSESVQDEQNYDFGEFGVFCAENNFDCGAVRERYGFVPSDEEMLQADSTITASYKSYLDSLVEQGK